MEPGKRSHQRCGRRGTPGPVCLGRKPSDGSGVVGSADVEVCPSEFTKFSLRGKDRWCISSGSLANIMTEGTITLRVLTRSFWAHHFANQFVAALCWHSQLRITPTTHELLAKPIHLWVVGAQGFHWCARLNHMRISEKGKTVAVIQRQT